MISPTSGATQLDVNKNSQTFLIDKSERPQTC